MRTQRPLAALLCCWNLVPGLALADEAPRASPAEARRIAAALAPRLLLPDARRPSPVVARTLLAPAPIGFEDDSPLAHALELSLRELDGPRPADPRPQLLTGDVTLRFPLGESFDLRPGMRIEYERHPLEDQWVGDPMPTLSVSMRF